jgi:hypothetical protein
MSANIILIPQDWQITPLHVDFNGFVTVEVTDKFIILIDPFEGKFRILKYIDEVMMDSDSFLAISDRNCPESAQKWFNIAILENLDCPENEQNFRNFSKNGFSLTQMHERTEKRIKKLGLRDPINEECHFDEYCSN